MENNMEITPHNEKIFNTQITKNGPVKEKKMQITDHKENKSLITYY